MVASALPGNVLKLSGSWDPQLYNQGFGLHGVRDTFQPEIPKLSNRIGETGALENRSTQRWLSVPNAPYYCQVLVRNIS